VGETRKKDHRAYQLRSEWDIIRLKNGRAESTKDWSKGPLPGKRTPEKAKNILQLTGKERFQGCFAISRQGGELEIGQGKEGTPFCHGGNRQILAKWKRRKVGGKVC